MSMPFTPQLLSTCDTIEEATRGKPASIEPKADGWRAVIESLGDGDADMRLRPGTDTPTTHLPELREVIGSIFPAGTLLDGEWCTVDDRRGLVTTALNSTFDSPEQREARQHVGATIWDCLRFCDLDMRPSTYAERRTALERIWEELDVDARSGGKLRLMPAWPASQANHEAILEQGFEGSVIKLHDARYSEGARGRGWHRLKATWTIDAVAMGFVAGEGERGEGRGLGAIVYGQYRDGELIERGRCGGGFTDELARRIWASREELVGAVFELRHFGFPKGSEDRPLSPQFIRWRGEEKRAEEVTWHDK
jgi:ATP-dependent DNA ligase